MWIELTAADGHRLAAWKDGPEDAARTLVVVQEIFGVNQHMRNVCARFVREGYAVICPALFDRTERGVEMGYAPEDVARGRELRTHVSAEGTLADIEAAATALPPGPRGIVGYCWGGTVAWWGATRSRRFRAANGWYGGGVVAAKDEPTHCPVQLHFGDKDASIPIADVEAIKAAQPGVEVFVYADAGHGFGCDERGSYSRPDAELAWERTLGFFGRHLA